MNEKRFHALRGLACAGLATVLFSLGSSAQACSFGSGDGSKSAALGKSGVAGAGEALRVEANAATPVFFPGAIVGLWQVTATSGGQVVDMAFEVFHGDGTEMINDITPPAEGNVCLGVWVQTSLTQYSLNHPSWVFDGNGNLTGTAIFKTTLTLTALNKFTGSYTLSYFDLKGNAGPVYTGTWAGTRVLPSN